MMRISLGLVWAVLTTVGCGGDGGSDSPSAPGGVAGHAGTGGLAGASGAGGAAGVAGSTAGSGGSSGHAASAGAGGAAGGGGSAGAGQGGGAGAPPEPTCAAGLVPGPGDVCMATGVRSCVSMFVEADGRCRPSASKCSAGTMPKFDEGCVPVGIPGCTAEMLGPDGICRPTLEACALGTIPQGSKGCLPVGPMSCAKEFLGKDGLCHATQTACAAGTFATPKGGCLPIDGAGCGSGTFGSVPDAAGSVYVDGSYTGSDSDGSKVKPFVTIAAAVAAAPSRVVIAAGTYAEPITIGQPIEIVGRCASMVTVTGTQDIGGGTFIAYVAGAASVALRGMTLAGPGIAVGVVTSTDVTLDHLHLQGKGFGVHIFGKPTTTATIDHCLIDDTAVSDDGKLGMGAEVDAGTTTFTSSALVGNSGFGLVGVNKSTVAMSDVLIEDTHPLVGSGIAVEAYKGSTITVDDSVVTGSHDTALFATDFSAAIHATRVLVEKSRELPGGALRGLGAIAQNSATISLTSSAVTDSLAAALLSGPMGTLTLDGVLIQGVAVPAGPTTGGGGIVANVGKVDAHGVVIADVPWNAIHAFAGGTVTGDDVVVERVVDPAHEAVAVVADAMSSVTLTRAMIQTADGALAGTAGGTVELTDSLLEGSNTQVGAVLTTVGTVTLTSTMIRETPGGAIIVGAGSTLQGKGVLIVGPTGGGSSGRGLQLKDGATVKLATVAIENAIGTGVLVGGSGTHVVIDGLVIEHGVPKTAGDFGRGVEVQTKAIVELTDAYIADNWNAGIFVVGGGDLTLTGGLVEGTHSQKSDGNWGVGMWAEQAATAHLTQVSFLKNHEMGLAVSSGSKVTATGIEVAGSLPEDSDQLFGMGIAVVQQGILELDGAVVHDTLCIGTAVWNSTITVNNSLFERVTAGKALLGGIPFDQTGDGFLATEMSKATITGLVSRQNQRAGIVVSDVTGTIAASSSTGNAYGIVLLGATQPTLASDVNLTGNSQQDSSTGGDLPVPSAPADIPGSGG